MTATSAAASSQPALTLERAAELLDKAAKGLRDPCTDKEGHFGCEDCPHVEKCRQECDELAAAAALVRTFARSESGAPNPDSTSVQSAARRTFADFINNATEAEKEEIYAEVMKRTCGFVWRWRLGYWGWDSWLLAWKIVAAPRNISNASPSKGKS